MILKINATRITNVSLLVAPIARFSTDLKILELCSFNEQAYTVCLQHCAVSVVLVFC